MRDYYYRVEGYAPPYADKLGHYGFNVHFDRTFAHKLLKTERNERTESRLEEIAQHTVGKLFGKRQVLDRHFRFMDDTLMLQYVTVPGNACDLGIDGNEMGEFKREKRPWFHSITYVPHNVDNHTQAFSLLSLFTQWAYIARVLTMPLK